MNKGGEADSSLFRVKRGDGTPATPEECLVPLFRKEKNGDWHLVGTGFLINTRGLIATAGHVLRDVVNSEGVQVAGLATFQILGGGECILRPIVRGAWHNRADVGVGILATATHNESDEVLTNRVLLFTEKTLKVGEPVHTFAFPNSTVRRGEKQNIVIQCDPYSGTVRRHYPDGRDLTFLPGQCYETSMVIHGGASGGPVFTSDGKVCGINSTGFTGSDGATNISHVSGIRELLDMVVDNVNTPDNPEARSIPVRELVSIDSGQ